MGQIRSRVEKRGIDNNTGIYFSEKEEKIYRAFTKDDHESSIVPYFAVDFDRDLYIFLLLFSFFSKEIRVFRRLSRLIPKRRLCNKY